MRTKVEGEAFSPCMGRLAVAHRCCGWLSYFTTILTLAASGSQRSLGWDPIQRSVFPFRNMNLIQRLCIHGSSFDYFFKQTCNLGILTTEILAYPILVTLGGTSAYGPIYDYVTTQGRRKRSCKMTTWSLGDS